MYGADFTPLLTQKKVGGAFKHETDGCSLGRTHEHMVDILPHWPLTYDLGCRSIHAVPAKLTIKRVSRSHTRIGIESKTKVVVALSKATKPWSLRADVER